VGIKCYSCANPYAVVLCPEFWEKAADMNIMLTKICTRCKVQKPTTDYSIAKRETDGLQHRCKVCNSIVAREYRLKNVEKEKIRHSEYHAANKDKINTRVSQWQKDNRDKCRARSKRYHANHTQREKTRMKEWSNKNLIWKKQYASKWQKENKNIINAIESKRRAAKLNATVKWANQNAIESKYMLATWMTKQMGIPYEVDHIIPL
jgi:hypothetical protein